MGEDKRATAIHAAKEAIAKRHLIFPARTGKRALMARFSIVWPNPFLRSGKKARLPSVGKARAGKGNCREAAEAATHRKALRLAGSNRTNQLSAA
jgi:hypothetical protein